MYPNFKLTESDSLYPGKHLYFLCYLNIFAAFVKTQAGAEG